MGGNGVSATTIHTAHVSILLKLTFTLKDSVFMAFWECVYWQDWPLICGKNCFIPLQSPSIEDKHSRARVNMRTAHNMHCTQNH